MPDLRHNTGDGLTNVAHRPSKFVLRYGDGDTDGPMSLIAAQEMRSSLRRDLVLPRGYEPMTIEPATA